MLLLAALLFLALNVQVHKDAIMPRPSSISRLPSELRDLIGRLREGGRTIDEILEKLRELDADVSRSALHRHIKTHIDAVGEKLRQSRMIAEGLIAKLGEGPSNHTARLNIELMHSIVQKLLITEDGEFVKLDQKDAFFLSKAMKELASASKTDVDRERAITDMVRKKIAAEIDNKSKEAADKVSEIANEGGLSEKAVQAIRQQVFKIKVAPSGKA